MNLLVTGASGLVGRHFCKLARQEGHSIRELSHRPRTGAILWDIPNQKLDASQIEGSDAVVHLAGESIVGLWTENKRERILNSRVQSTRLLAETLAGLKQKPSVLVSASAIGIYGDSPGEVNETAAAGDTFLAQVCQAWEAATAPARDAGIRVVHPRIGIVLSEEAGALASMLPAFKAGIAGRLGDGKQAMSWIDIDDLARIFLFLIKDTELSGAINMTAPGIVDNRTFTRLLARQLKRPAWLPAPACLLTTVLGDMARELLLNDIRALPDKLTSAGFAFHYPDLQSSLNHLLPRT